MARKMTALSAALLLSLLPACGRREQKPRDWSAEMRKLEAKYAPDPRLGVFRVKVSEEKGRVVAEGEVDNPAAEREILQGLASAGAASAEDRIVVLPDPALGGRDKGIVNVAVGNVRREPEHSAELITQLLLGQIVRVLKADGGWLYVQGPDRYLGWIDDDALLQTDSPGGREWEDAEKLVVTSRFGLLRERADKSALPVSDLSMGNLLRGESERGGWIRAQLPDGRAGFVPADIVEPYPAWKAARRVTPDNIEASARQFLGVPYLWGGTSARGFDCSGFVKTVFSLNGVELLRDAGQQAAAGVAIEAGPDFAGLQRGDLLFFGRKESAERPERIWHVGIYLGGRSFIHCSGRVRTNSLDPASPDYDEGRNRTFVRARRLVDASSARIP